MSDTEKQNNTLKIIDELPEKSSIPIKLAPEKDSKISLIPQQPSETTSKKKLKKLKREHAPNVSEILDKTVETTVNPEESWGESHIKIPSGWFVLAIILLISSIFLGVYQINGDKNKKDIQIDSIEQSSHTKIINTVKEKRENQQILKNMQSATEHFFLARNIEELLPYVRTPKRVKPLMEKYYKTHSFHPKKLERITHIFPTSIDHFSFVFIKSIFDDGSSCPLILEEVKDNTFRVDWESHVCYQPIPWETYIATRPTTPTNMRVYLSPDTLYAFEVRDESQYTCYKLTTLKSDSYIFGYVKKGSPVAKKLAKYAGTIPDESSTKENPAILRLRFFKNSHSKRFVWIDDVIVTGWTYTIPPKDK